MRKVGYVGAKRRNRFGKFGTMKMRASRQNGKRAVRSALAVLFLGAAAACAPISRNHGYVPPPEDLAQLTIGQDTRETVSEKIGAPLNTGLNREGAWYYISTRRQTFGLREQRILSRDIVALRFAESGRLENIERLELEDGRLVVLSARVTDPSVSEAGFLSQVFGNLGGVTASQYLEPN